MECMGAAMDTNSFKQILEGGGRPDAKALVYDGVFNENFMKASSTEKLLEPFGHCGVDRFGNLFVGVEYKMGANMGAARDTNSFSQLVGNNRRPPPQSLVYDGVFNEHFVRASTTEKLIEPFGHCGVDRFGNLFLGVEVVSCRDGKPRDTSVALDIVFVIDISGSMGSALGGGYRDTTKPRKIDAVKGFAVELAEKLQKDDTVSVVLFDTTAETILNPTKISDGGVAKVRDALKNISDRGGTDIACGLLEGAKIAREAKKLRGSASQQETRIVLLTDMSDNEVRNAEKVIQETTVKLASQDNIHITYVGVGEDFDHELTEKITVAEGCNYCCIMNTEDFTKNVAGEIGSVFFPTVKNMELALITKQFKITGIWGAGKEGAFEHEDPTGWSLEKGHLYGESTQVSTQKMTERNVPSDIVGVIVDQTESKPIVVAQENSVFPSPSSDKPGYQKGGWIIVGIQPEDNKGSAQGYVRFEIRYTEFGDSQQKKVVRDVNLAEAEAAISAGKKNWYSDEGMEKAMVLKQYVDGVREALADESCKAFPSDFLEWFEQQHARFDLSSEKEKISKIAEIIAKDDSPKTNQYFDSNVMG